MFITPMTSISDVSNDNSKLTVAKNTGNMFADVFNSAINDVVQTSQKVDQNIYDLSVGNMDNLHDMQIDLAKAQTSLQFMIQLRNKAMESYTEIMRISV